MINYSLSCQEKCYGYLCYILSQLLLSIFSSVGWRPAKNEAYPQHLIIQPIPEDDQNADSVMISKMLILMYGIQSPQKIEILLGSSTVQRDPKTGDADALTFNQISCINLNNDEPDCDRATDLTRSVMLQNIYASFVKISIDSDGENLHPPSDGGILSILLFAKSKIQKGLNQSSSTIGESLGNEETNAIQQKSHLLFSPNKASSDINLRLEALERMKREKAQNEVSARE